MGWGRRGMRSVSDLKRCGGCSVSVLKRSCGGVRCRSRSVRGVAFGVGLEALLGGVRCRSRSVLAWRSVSVSKRSWACVRCRSRSVAGVAFGAGLEACVALRCRSRSVLGCVRCRSRSVASAAFGAGLEASCGCVRCRSRNVDGLGVIAVSFSGGVRHPLRMPGLFSCCCASPIRGAPLCTPARRILRTRARSMWRSVRARVLAGRGRGRARRGCDGRRRRGRVRRLHLRVVRHRTALRASTSCRRRRRVCRRRALRAAAGRSPRRGWRTGIGMRAGRGGQVAVATCSTRSTRSRTGDAATAASNAWNRDRSVRRRPNDRAGRQ